jgi:hypothetical protein
LPIITPIARQLLISQEPLAVSSLYPTLIASEKAMTPNKSLSHGITINEAAKLHNEIICNFLRIFSIKLI